MRCDDSSIDWVNALKPSWKSVPLRNYRKITKNQSICSFFLRVCHLASPYLFNLIMYYAALVSRYRLLTASWTSCALSHLCLYSCGFLAKSAPFSARQKFLRLQALMTMLTPLCGNHKLLPSLPIGNGFSLFKQLGVMFIMYYHLCVCLWD